MNARAILIATLIGVAVVELAAREITSDRQSEASRVKRLPPLDALAARDEPSAIGRRAFRLPCATTPFVPASEPAIRLSECVEPPRDVDPLQSAARADRWWPIHEELRDDLCHYYSATTMRDLAIAVAFAAPVANTSLDRRIGDWSQDAARSVETDRFAAAWKDLGEGKYVLPACAGLAIGGTLLDRIPAMDPAGEFGRRTTRAFLVGGPPMLAMQCALGGSRPGETSFDSRWKPGDDVNAVSGHAFIGAVPCITAARMCDDPYLRGVFYACSIVPVWSRVNDDAHYLSQACLGWYMAYLACRSIDRTERKQPSAELLPMAGPDFQGLGLIWHR